MSDTNSTCLETFPGWLRNLGQEAEALGELLNLELPKDAHEAIAGGLNYLFKSLDLIPDGIDDIGYLDDAFVLRVASDLATREDLSGASVEDTRIAQQLASDCDLIRDFLEKDYERLESYVTGLKRGAARGRAVTDILGDGSVKAEFLGDLRAFASSYESPAFAQEEKNLIKLRAFFDAKLPK